MPCVWCLVPGSYQTTRRQRPLTAPIHDRSIAENSINLILSRHLTIQPGKRVPLKVVVHRNSGPRRGLTLTVVGLPSGVRPQRRVTILRGNQTEAALVLEPNIVGAGITRRQNPFIGREFDTRPYDIVVNASVGQRLVASSPATKLSIANQ